MIRRGGMGGGQTCVHSSERTLLRGKGSGGTKRKRKSPFEQDISAPPVQLEHEYPVWRRARSLFKCSCCSEIDGILLLLSHPPRPPHPRSNMQGDGIDFHLRRKALDPFG